MTDLRLPKPFGASFGHRLLVCRLVAISFPNNTTVRLYLADGDCSDMSGAIELATRLVDDLSDFQLRRIETISGDRYDTLYVLRDDGVWQATDHLVTWL